MLEVFDDNGGQEGLEGLFMGPGNELSVETVGVYCVFCIGEEDDGCEWIGSDDDLYGKECTSVIGNLLGW